jgi:acetamidase/formamidase
MQVAIFQAPDLTRAMTDSFNKTRDFIMDVYNFSENEALALMGIAIDFGISQVRSPIPLQLSREPMLH